MKIESNLTVHEAKKYAEKNGYNSTMFCMHLYGLPAIAGKFIDAYFGIVVMPALGAGFCTLNQLCNIFEERNISFDIVDEEGYNDRMKIDFMFFGKEGDDILEE